MDPISSILSTADGIQGLSGILYLLSAMLSLVLKAIRLAAFLLQLRGFEDKKHPASASLPAMLSLGLKRSVSLELETLMFLIKENSFSHILEK